jgi:hypothetical protein
LLIRQGGNIDILGRTLPAMEEVQKDSAVTGGSVGLQVIQERTKIMKQLKARHHTSVQGGVNLKQWRNLNILGLY